MPATVHQQPAFGATRKIGKNNATPLRSRHFLAARLSNPVFAGVDFLDVTAIDKLRERPRDVLARQIEVQRDQRGALHGEDLGVRERFEDAILTLRHPLGAVPKAHSYTAVLGPGLSNVAWGCLGVILCYAFVTKYKALASRHGCNDWPGALGEGLRAGDRRPRPGGRYPTTMSETTHGDLKSRHSTDAMATIARADRAYHDVAQLHLHEFGGDGS